jgi:ABC-type multidrug transport system fused ATPase/permease subunit
MWMQIQLDCDSVMSKIKILLPLSAWRAAITLVPQSICLADSSIAENISFH